MVSISYRLSTPCRMDAIRSRPIPVSTFLDGSGPSMSKSSLARNLAQLVLHEDQVPDLQEAVLVGLRAAVAAVVGPAVVVDLRARPARAGHAHVPVVVGQAAGLDPVFGQADLVPPDRERLVVAVQDRGPQLALREPEAAVGLGLGQQLPGVPDRAFLEVVAERPVAEHLEERGVPGGLADLLDVQRAHALLHVGHPPVRRRLLAEQVRLERLHARDDEQHRGIIGDQGGRRHDGVPLLLEIGKEAAGDLCRLHQRPSLGRGSSLVWSLTGRSRAGSRPGAPRASRAPRVEPAGAECRAIYSSMPSRTSRVNRNVSRVTPTARCPAACQPCRASAAPWVARRPGSARRRVPRG